MKQEIYNTLDRLGIDYTCLEHPPIMTMEEGMTIAQKLGVPWLPHLPHSEYS